jgi:hypothetical protein
MADFTERHRADAGEGMHDTWLNAEPRVSDGVEVFSLGFASELEDTWPGVPPVGKVMLETRTAEGYTGVQMTPQMAEFVGMALISAARHARDEAEKRYAWLAQADDD